MPDTDRPVETARFRYIGPYEAHVSLRAPDGGLFPALKPGDVIEAAAFADDENGDSTIPPWLEPADDEPTAVAFRNDAPVAAPNAQPVDEAVDPGLAPSPNAPSAQSGTIEEPDVTAPAVDAEPMTGTSDA